MVRRRASSASRVTRQALGKSDRDDCPTEIAELTRPLTYFWFTLAQA
jgi:hypothetical protein